MNTRFKSLLLIFLCAIPSTAKPQTGTGAVIGKIHLPNGEAAVGHSQQNERAATSSIEAANGIFSKRLTL